jgi:hypothetical protein
MPVARILEDCALVAAGHVPPAGSEKKKHRRSSDQAPAEPSEEGGELDAQRWEPCLFCARWVVVSFPPPGEASQGPSCADCGKPIALTEGQPMEAWVQCDDCGKWRSLPRHQLRALAEQGESAAWSCAMRRPGATCKTSGDEWGTQRKRVARESGGGAAAAAGAAGLALSDRCQAPSAGESHTVVLWALPHSHSTAPAGPSGAMHGAPVGGVRPASRCEFVPGRDALWPPQRLRAGLDGYDTRAPPDAGSEPFLMVRCVSLDTLRLAQPFVGAAIAAFYAGKLPELRDGRESAGPVDVPAFLAEARNAEAVEAALFRRKARLGGGGSRGRSVELNFVVHVKHNSRAMYIGEECDVTASGKSVMAFGKSWKGNPIRSWSGGRKMADMPGTVPKLVRSKLSILLAHVEHTLLELAAELWAVFAAAQPAAARRQLGYLSGGRRSAQLGSSGWNAYSFNLDYATAAHYDSKNVAQSWSALAVLETGEPFAGGLYLLPQYRAALELRQGLVLFHRSGDPEVGLHANSSLHLPEPASHRVALVFYLTQISDAAAEALAAEEARAAAGGAAAAEADGEAEAEAEAAGGTDEGEED